MQTVIYDILVKLTKLLSPILVHTSEEVWKYLKEEEAYVMTIQDDGVGFDELHYGYGLKQMQERLMIIGGSVRFENRDGFYTHIKIPKIGGRHD